MREYERDATDDAQALATVHVHQPSFQVLNASMNCFAVLDCHHIEALHQLIAAVAGVRDVKGKNERQRQRRHRSYDTVPLRICERICVRVTANEAYPHPAIVPLHVDSLRTIH